jgi:hypothetical protein
MALGTIKRVNFCIKRTVRLLFPSKQAFKQQYSMDNHKAPKKTWFQPKTSNGKCFGTRINQGGPQKEQQQQNKKSFETSDRTKQIMRHIYPINNSGSKQLVIGCDPQADFQPIITIRKPGYRGVVLSHEASKALLDEFEELYLYCNDDSTDKDRKSLELTQVETVDFGYSMQKKAIFIKKDLGDSQHASIILSGSTLMFIADLFDLIKYIFDLLRFNSSEIKNLYDMMHAELQRDPANKKQLLKTLDPNDTNFNPLNRTIDYARVFLELRKYCELELLA